MSGPDAKALARAHRESMQRRTRLIRRSVAVLAVTLFVLVFGIVYVQLASGHDPALVAAARRRAAASASRPSDESTGTGPSESTAAGSGEFNGNNGSGESGGGSSLESEASGPSAVSTSQS